MHIPVLLNEVLEYLEPKPECNYVDCTLNGGGHTKEILKRNDKNGLVMGIEVDKDIFNKINQEEINRLVAVNDSYSNLKEIVTKEKFKNINGILFDIGMSSYHIDQSEKGFSFLKDEPLFMSYNVDKGNQRTAYEIVNQYNEKDLVDILFKYGEERYSRKIAKSIIEKRKKRSINTTFELVDIIASAVPMNYKRGKIHFATRTFQALRIEVNRELDNFFDALPQALEVLDSGGRIVVITFHSLEDRIVKNYFRDWSKKGLVTLLTKKPITAQDQEIKENPRSRSAKLRAVIKL